MKMRILDYARQIYRVRSTRYRKFADKFEVLFLPMSHPEFNPVETGWPSVKRAVAAKNINF